MQAIFLFPESSLASSVITTVWVGVIVVVFYNLSFGWVLSGLVVPGYLTPLFIIKPWSAAVIILEGIITYLCVWLFSEKLSGLKFWSSLFGRDRFFALVLVSIIVRIILDGWALPLIGEGLEKYGYQFDYRNNLHSFGLIIVALVANQFWKTGLIRGIPPFFVILASSYIIVEYVLIRHTNFGLGAVNYLYDDLAGSILSAPKAYIILITTAYFASRMNLKYGWDFNGILLPALIALQWYQPSKIVISFIEAYIILTIANLLLKTPLLAKVTIEGGVKLLLFFNIAFFYKLLLGHIIYFYLPKYNANHLFAFGYLLSTLLAIKMHDSSIAIRLTRATVQTSLISVAVASLIGYAITFIPAGEIKTSFDHTKVILSPLSIDDRFKEILPKLYAQQDLQHYDKPIPSEVESFKRAIVLLAKLDKYDSAIIDQVSTHLSKANYKAEIVENRYIFIKSKSEYYGSSTFLIDLDKKNHTSLEIPKPFEVRHIINNGYELFKSQSFASLSIAGAESQQKSSLDKRNTYFHIFHTTYSRNNTIQLRWQSPNITSQVNAQITNDNNQDASSLWITGNIPQTLSLSQLKTVIGEFQILWGAPSGDNLQRATSNKVFAELFLSKSARVKLSYSQLTKAKTKGINSLAKINQSESGIALRLHEEIKYIAQEQSNLYRAPTQDELKYFELEIFSPSLELSEELSRQSIHELQADIDAIASAAAVLDYKIEFFENTAIQQRYLILHRNNHKLSNYWGTYAINIDWKSSSHIQVPNPQYDAYTELLGIQFLEMFKARYFSLSGTHPHANNDRSSQLTLYDNQASVLNLYSEMIHRRNINSLTTIQLRSYSPKNIDNNRTIFVRNIKGLPESSSPRDPAFSFFNQMQVAGWELNAKQSYQTSKDISIGFSSQAKYIDTTNLANFFIIWLPNEVRHQAVNWLDKSFTESMKTLTETQEITPISILKLINTPHCKSKPVTKPKNLLWQYIHSNDLSALHKFIAPLKGQTYRLHMLKETGDLLLVTTGTKSCLSSIINLNSYTNSSATINQENEPDKVKSLLLQKTSILEYSP